MTKMNYRIAIMAAASALMAGLPCHAAELAAKKPQLAVYRWGAPKGPGQVTTFTKWLGQPGVWGEDFEPAERWDGVEGGGWQLGPWSDWKKQLTGRRLILSIPLLPGGWNRSGPKSGPGAGEAVSYDDAAAGKYNEHFKKLAENLVAAGLGDSILRLGWEMNGGWYTWRVESKAKQYAEYFRQIVTTMRAVPGAKDLKFCFNPASGWLQFPADQAYPGDDVVDYVGLDLYDQSWVKGTYPFPKDATPDEVLARQRTAWDDLLNGDHNLIWWSKFAAKHNKPFSIPEWGVCHRGDGHGGEDNPYFVEQMAKFIADPANNVAFHCYFDVVAGDGDHQLSTGEKETFVTKFPNSAAAFKKIYGGSQTAAATK